MPEIVGVAIGSMHGRQLGVGTSGKGVDLQNVARADDRTFVSDGIDRVRNRRRTR
jgi:hypothetical protein